jgi:hypothetical protein
MNDPRSQEKERICREAESLAQGATNFAEAARRLGELRRELTKVERIGLIGGRDVDREYSERFEAASRQFDSRRAASRESTAQAREAARYTKERLVAEAQQISGSNDWKAGAERFRELDTQWKLAGSAGRDVEPWLWQQYRSAKDEFFRRRGESHQRAAMTKRSLISEASELARSTDWKRAGEKFRELDKKWKEAGFAGRDLEDSLWQEYRSKKDEFFNRRKKHFDEQDRNRDQARRAKEFIISEASSLANSSEWKWAAEKFRELDARWKKAGSAGRDHEDGLWRRYRAHKDWFFERRTKHFNQQERERDRAYEAKRALLGEASRIACNEDIRTAGKSWKAMMVRWKATGSAGRERNDALWRDLQKWRQQLDMRFEGAKRERIQRWQEQAARLSDQRARLINLIGEINSRPIRPGPKAWEIQGKRQAKVASISQKVSLIDQRLTDLYWKIRS